MHSGCFHGDGAPGLASGVRLITQLSVMALGPLPLRTRSHAIDDLERDVGAGSLYALCMDVEEIRQTLTANIGRRLRIEFGDGVTQSVEIGSVDDEGFLHSGPQAGGDSRGFWTRFESVRSIQLDPLSS